MVVLKNKALRTIILAMLMGAGLLVAGLLVAPMDRAGAAFQGTNGKIAFDSNRNAQGVGLTNLDIFTLTPGGGVTPVLGATASNDKQPNWSSDGTKIAFASNRNNGPNDFDIYTVNADGTQLTQRTTGSPVDQNPAFSPDGTKIAFERGGDIFTVTLAGGGIDPVTTSLSVDVDPNWSPDGTKIAFQRGSDIYTVNADGSNQIPVVQGPLATSANINPNWSPDGTKIAFASNRGNAANDFDIFTVTLAGGGLTKLPGTRGRVTQSQPTLPMAPG